MLRAAAALLAAALAAGPAADAPAPDGCPRGGCTACRPAMWRPLTNNLPPRADDAGTPARPEHDVRDAELVIAHCTSPLDWAPPRLAQLGACGVRVVRATVYSKCGGEAPDWGVPSLPFPVRVRALGNVGREGHTWATHLSCEYERLAPLVLLWPDTLWQSARAPTANAHTKRFRSVEPCDAARAAAARGFACMRRAHVRAGQARRVRQPCARASPSLSDLHLSASLMQFRLDGGYASPFQKAEDGTRRRARPARPNETRFEALHRPLGRWVERALAPAAAPGALALRGPLTPVCYRGSFVAQAARVRRTPRAVWAAVARALSRGDNIEEGHYMERLWAALLADAPEPDEARKLMRATKRVLNGSNHLTHGVSVLSGCSCAAAALLLNKNSTKRPARRRA